MKELKECPVNIGSKVSIIFETLDINSVNEDRNPLKAKMAIKYLDEPYGKIRLEELKGMEHSVWVQIGENDRVYNIVIEDKNSKDNKEINTLFYSLLFELSNLMVKDLQSGATLFAGIEHPNYNVRTQEIPRSLSNSLTEILLN